VAAIARTGWAAPANQGPDARIVLENAAAVRLPPLAVPTVRCLEGRWFS